MSSVFPVIKLKEFGVQSCLRVCILGSFSAHFTLPYDKISQNYHSSHIQWSVMLLQLILHLLLYLITYLHHFQHQERPGCFYPLQSCIKNKNVNKPLKKVYVCVCMSQDVCWKIMILQNCTMEPLCYSCLIYYGWC